MSPASNSTPCRPGVTGGSATRRSSPSITPRPYRPGVDGTLAQVGAIQAYDNMMGQYGQLPFVPDVKADLTNYALDMALQGLFHYIAVEEAAICENLVKRTTEVLQKVFDTVVFCFTIDEQSVQFAHQVMGMVTKVIGEPA